MTTPAEARDQTDVRGTAAGPEGPQLDGRRASTFRESVPTGLGTAW
jgi:hypothetical protein